MDLMLLQGEMRPEWKRQCLSQGGQVTNFDLPEAHVLPYKVYGLDLQTSQLPCHILTVRQLISLDLRSPNKEVIGGVSSTNILQPPRECPKPWRCHGKFHNPLLWYSVAGEYCSYVLEYFSGPNIII